MPSQALYLKWRPQRFEDVVGQGHVTQTLKNALRAGRIAHAYLFSGPRGTGKTTMARLLAKAVNCLDEDVDVRPCNVCHICQAVNEGRLLDLIEMDAASHTGVDNVREAIRDKVGFRPAEARYKVYVIDEVHMLSTSAFNALLKTLEEPPEHVIFCLATTEPHKILPTILSRCQRFDFRRIPRSAMVARLEHIADQEGIAVQRDVLDFIARAATGSARDAISLLDQLATYGDEVITLARARAVLGLSDVLVVRNLVSALAGHDVGRGLDVINQVIDGGGDARQFAQQVVDYLRSILLLRVGGDAAALDLDAQTLGDVQDLVPRFSTGTLLQAIKLFNQAQLDLRSSDQGQLALELALVEATMVSLPSPPVQKPDAGRALPGGGTVVREMADDGGTEGGSRSVRPPKPAAVELAAGAGDLPSAPPRSGRRSGQEPTAGRGPQTVQGSTQTEPVTLEEVDLHWAEVRHAIREDSRQVEALVNSSVLRGVEDLNRLVLEFASDFLSGKLEKEENKRIVERALSAVLDKPCRVRGVVRGSFSPPTGTRRPHVESPAPPSAAPGATTSMVKESAAGSQDAGSTEGDEQEPNEDLDPEAPFDPVVQDLIDRGGQVTDVQVLSEE